MSVHHSWVLAEEYRACNARKLEPALRRDWATDKRDVVQAARVLLAGRYLDYALPSPLSESGA